MFLRLIFLLLAVPSLNYCQTAGVLEQVHVRIEPGRVIVTLANGLKLPVVVQPVSSKLLTADFQTDGIPGKLGDDLTTQLSNGCLLSGYLEDVPNGNKSSAWFNLCGWFNGAEILNEDFRLVLSSSSLTRRLSVDANLVEYAAVDCASSGIEFVKVNKTRSRRSVDEQKIQRVIDVGSDIGADFGASKRIYLRLHLINYDNDPLDLTSYPSPRFNNCWELGFWHDSNPLHVSSYYEGPTRQNKTTIRYKGYCNPIVRWAGMFQMVSHANFLFRPVGITLYVAKLTVTNDSNSVRLLNLNQNVNNSAYDVTVVYGSTLPDTGLSSPYYGFEQFSPIFSAKSAYFKYDLTKKINKAHGNVVEVRRSSICETVAVVYLVPGTLSPYPEETLLDLPDEHHNAIRNNTAVFDGIRLTHSIAHLFGVPDQDISSTCYCTGSAIMSPLMGRGAGQLYYYQEHSYCWTPCDKVQFAVTRDYLPSTCRVWKQPEVLKPAVLETTLPEGPMFEELNETNCGNGIVEPSLGEECDCGAKTSYEVMNAYDASRFGKWLDGPIPREDLRIEGMANPDWNSPLKGSSLCYERCCDPRTCRRKQELLSQNSTCAAGPCCDRESCRIKPAADKFVCRTADSKNPCDTSETCDGSDWACPVDKSAKDGSVCYDTAVFAQASDSYLRDITRGRCFDGKCRARWMQCLELWRLGSNSTETEYVMLQTAISHKFCNNPEYSATSKNGLSPLRNLCGHSVVNCKSLNLNGAHFTPDKYYPCDDNRPDDAKCGFIKCPAPFLATHRQTVEQTASQFKSNAEKYSKCSFAKDVELDYDVKEYGSSPVAAFFEVIKNTPELTTNEANRRVGCVQAMCTSNEDLGLVVDGTPCAAKKFCQANRCEDVPKK